MIQIVKYYAGMKKKGAALYVLMREDHQDRWLGEKKSKVQNYVYRMLLFMQYRLYKCVCAFAYKGVKSVT